jgi:hypothetical protein
VAPKRQEEGNVVAGGWEIDETGTARGTLGLSLSTTRPRHSLCGCSCGAVRASGFGNTHSFIDEFHQFVDMPEPQTSGLPLSEAISRNAKLPCATICVTVRCGVGRLPGRGFGDEHPLLNRALLSSSCGA